MVLLISVYDYEEALEYAFCEWYDVWKDKNVKVTDIIEKVYGNNVEAVVDFPHSHFFNEFLQRWPKAKVRTRHIVHQLSTQENFVTVIKVSFIYEPR